MIEGTATSPEWVEDSTAGVQADDFMVRSDAGAVHVRPDVAQSGRNMAARAHAVVTGVDQISPWGTPGDFPPKQVY